MKYRATPKERDRIKKAAKVAGMGASKLQRDAIMRRVVRIEKQAARQPEGESE